MIELRGIGLRYAERDVLRDVDLTLDEGELVLVAGRTGVGKSTLLGVVTGLVPRFTGGVLTGDVLLDGASIVDQPPRERAHLVGYVGQDPLAGFVTDTVEEELAYGMEQLAVAPETMRRRVEETLDLLGIADLRDRDLRTLSGGQQQRVAIGSVLTTHPRVLVLDEPTSALDPTAAEDVLATITRLVHDLGLTVVLAEHRLERVVPFADRIALVTGDGGIRVGDPQEVLTDSPGRPAARRAGPARRLGAAPADGARRPPATPARCPCSPRRRGRAAPPSEPRLTARGVTVVHGTHVAVREVDLTLSAGRGHRPDGPQRLGQVEPHLGAAGHRAGDARARCTSAGTTPPRWRPRSGVRTSGSCRRPPPTCSTSRPSPRSAPPPTPAPTPRPAPAAACSTGSRPGIPDTTHPRDLSEGQRLALALAIVLTARPPVVLLDEPTRGLDYAGKAELARIVADLARDGRAVLLATHDVEFAAHVADDVQVLAEGEIVSSGPPQRVLAESPSYAPQVTKVLGAPWLVVEDVAAALAGGGAA